MGCVGINPISRKGGLALLWRKLDDLEIFNYSHNHISAWVKRKRVMKCGSLAGFMVSLKLIIECVLGISSKILNPLI